MAVQDDNPYVTLNIPPRPDGSMTGTQFVSSIMSMPLGPERELAIFQQFELGNVPAFMRTLCPVTANSMSFAGAPRTSTFWVTPDYLCVGTDDDFVRVPMNPQTATRIADLYGAFLPTRRVVNQIFDAAALKLIARPKPSGPAMTSTKYFYEHNQTIQDQLSGTPPGQLLAGHKKDVVLCKALFDGRPYPAGHKDRVAIYGWARTIENGRWEPWQALNPNTHECTYADYSHGIRLVAGTITVNLEEVPYDEVLTSPVMAGVLSDEGPLPGARYPGA